MKFLNKLQLKQPVSIFNLALTGIISIILFLFILGNFNQYQSEVSIVAIPRSEFAISQMEQIAQNIEKIPTRLAFYEKIIRENKNFVDNFSQKENDQRKDAWNKSLQIKRDGNSLIFNLTASAKKRADAETLANKTATTLFAVMAQYYNIETDLDFRIIDGPLTAKAEMNWLLSIVVCIFLATLIVIAINVIFGKLDRWHYAILVRKKVPELKINIPKSWYAPEKKLQNSAIFPIKKHQAPPNLPIAPEEKIIEATGEPEIISAAEKREPTEEELKRRLNQLLRG